MEWLMLFVAALIGFSIGLILKDNYRDGYIISISKDKFENGLIHTEYHTITFSDGNAFWVDDLKHIYENDYLQVGKRIRISYNPKHRGILSWDSIDEPILF